MSFIQECLAIFGKWLVGYLVILFGVMAIAFVFALIIGIVEAMAQ